MPWNYVGIRCHANALVFTFFLVLFSGESDAQTAAVVPQCNFRLLLRQPECARVNTETV